MIEFSNISAMPGSITGYWDVGVIWTKDNVTVFYYEENTPVASVNYASDDVVEIVVDGENWIVEEWESDQS